MLANPIKWNIELKRDISDFPAFDVFLISVHAKLGIEI